MLNTGRERQGASLLAPLSHAHPPGWWPRVSHHFILIPCLARQIAFCSVLMAIWSEERQLWSLELGSCSPWPGGQSLLVPQSSAVVCLVSVSVSVSGLWSLVSGLWCLLFQRQHQPLSLEHARPAPCQSASLSLRPCCHTFPIVNENR
ncbi:hypothetical protein N431DRAFT_49158 [Stipitochalara longipes BDJ]|nr:hypothetical protein N431DRAFT_49158 [Stipitochalara longipes BDJ]